MVTRQVTVQECMGHRVRGREASAALPGKRKREMEEDSPPISSQSSLSQKECSLGISPTPDPIAQLGQLGSTPPSAG